MSKKDGRGSWMCARCGEPARGFATITIGGWPFRFCHDDEKDGPSCYELATQRLGR